MSMTPEEFAAGARQILGKKAEPTPATPAPTSPTSPHWTARTDRIGAVRLAPRRGYGTESLFVWAYKDGSLVIDDALLEPAAARRLIRLWSARYEADRAAEFEYGASPTVTVRARWAKWGDGKSGWQLHVFDKRRPITSLMHGVTASEREALAKARDLLEMRNLAHIDP